MTSSAPRKIAVVDLGSNSFRLEIGEVIHQTYTKKSYLKETIRLGAQLDAQGNLSPQAMESGWECLRQFHASIRLFNPCDVRAVATQTLREAKNSQEFLKKAKEFFTFPIRVISGEEEASLIYQGVASQLAEHEKQKRHVVIDVGGRSTELIIGQRGQAQTLHSFPIGSLSWLSANVTMQSLTPEFFAKATRIAQQMFGNDLLAHYTADQWETAYGAAGTVSAILDVLSANGFTGNSITQDGLDWLLEQLLLAKNAKNPAILGLHEDKFAIIGGGLSIIRVLFSALPIQNLRKVEGGLRQGLIYELLASPH